MSTKSLVVYLYTWARARSGRSPVEPDPELPISWIPRVSLELLPELVRGCVRTQRMMLMGPRVKVRGVSRIVWGRGSRIGQGSTIDGYSATGVVFGPASRIGDYSVVTCTSHVSRLGRGFELGAGSGFGDYCHFGASGGIRIGEHVLAGAYVSFHAQDHQFESQGQLIRDQGVTEKGIQIGSNCWIGAKATFLDGTSVGEGSVVAAGAVVKGHFPPRVVIGGVPARILRHLDDTPERGRARAASSPS